MTESVIVGGCVRTLLFTITGLMQCDGICTCNTAEIEGCTHSHSCICNQNLEVGIAWGKYSLLTSTELISNAGVDFSTTFPAADSLSTCYR